MRAQGKDVERNVRRLRWSCPWNTSDYTPSSLGGITENLMVVSSPSQGPACERFCGVVGFKPSQGLTPPGNRLVGRYPPVSLSPVLPDLVSRCADAASRPRGDTGREGTRAGPTAALTFPSRSRRSPELQRWVAPSHLSSARL